MDRLEDIYLDPHSLPEEATVTPCEKEAAEWRHSAAEVLQRHGCSADQLELLRKDVAVRRAVRIVLAER